MPNREAARAWFASFVRTLAASNARADAFLPGGRDPPMRIERHAKSAEITSESPRRLDPNPTPAASCLERPCHVSKVSISRATARRVISLTYLYGVGPEDRPRAVPQGGHQTRHVPRPRADRGRGRPASPRCSTRITRSRASSAGRCRQNISRLREIACYRGLRHRRGPAGPRPANQDQRPHPQRSEEDGRR